MNRWEKIVLLMYILAFAGPVSIAVVGLNQWLDWILGLFGRDTPGSIRRLSIWIVHAVSRPVPDMGDALPDSPVRAENRSEFE